MHASSIRVGVSRFSGFAWLIVNDDDLSHKKCCEIRHPALLHSKKMNLGTHMRARQPEHLLLESRIFHSMLPCCILFQSRSCNFVLFYFLVQYSHIIPLSL